ncbi:hypothetical protein SAMD00019534_022600 [Acytostelium subglobosum LB1]|uniref:hypothetical protein n=1 Tax=Acytostelium subglobosum LB1 TaxID=1410327 RepID=UPI000644EE3A|nr:hypothetical protein SAMD00019534_022600 [Acytostelium subglobosum LB1]GAM19085.1 hypothetical protein SAMD00019534_022600 [Acytostelium subglobosum LB1]|eukprot:XP_012757012.1 hypothetical protein SAMD00019534_022600 [Acytostelium subglobosum LB1]
MSSPYQYVKPQAQAQVQPQVQPKQQQQQNFKYIVVLDFEATCQEGPRIEKQEIIEFPSLLVDLEKRQVVDTFREYVRPVHNPKLTPFCTELTGIQQEWVDAADTFPTVVERHRLWLVKNGLIDPHTYQKVPGKEFTFLTCGDWDLNMMLPTQYKYMDESQGRYYSWPSYFQDWINVKRSFESHTGQAGRGMTDMLSKMHLELQGRHHSGLDDCTNIAAIVIKLLNGGFVFVNTNSRAPKLRGYQK